ncbi:MAG: preprotein translocase subunit SecE [bacterium]
MSFSNYVKDTKSEMRHVNWPTRQQTINYTILVIAISIFTALFLGFFDSVFVYLLKLVTIK